MLPVKHWWTLRRRFKKSIPGTVTANYLASVLKMQVNSARANVLGFLIDLGIVDEAGVTLDRAKRWRDDVEYSAVCKEIREDVYPQELLDAVPDPADSRDAAERWFANHTGAGQAAVNRMTALYTLLVTADADDVAAPAPAAPTKQKTRSKPKAKQTKKREAPPPKIDPPENTPNEPDISINLQIHISSDASPDQIDKIFESMAKHIYRKI